MLARIKTCWTPKQEEWPRPIRSGPHVGSLKRPKHVAHEEAPPRLQKMIMTVQKYPLVVQYRPGKELVIADTLSRAFVPETDDKLIPKEFEVNVL